MKAKELPEGFAPASDLLEGRIILVTGAGSGIGRTVALAYAQHGATVLLLGRTVSGLETVYDEIVKASLPEPGIIPLDLGKLEPATLDQISEVITQRYGRLDGLLHNAGMLGDRVPFESCDLNVWQKVMDVNYTAVVILTRYLMDLLKTSDNASVVLTSSGVGARPRAYWGSYAVSKYAIEGLAELLADEFENTSRIRVNVINPGATRTPMRAAAYPNEDPRELKTADALVPLYLYLMDPKLAAHGCRFTF
ncbi:MAG: YciK family oxidoreductase [Proteobacteria bacterium]|nr:YciK family oxidoreductase [Pseudomonadota bacterium]MDA1301178.1 YciK family oxidoreductase [Pseudomonadota bacterium]